MSDAERTLADQSTEAAIRDVSDPNALTPEGFDFAAFVAKQQGTVNADEVALMMAENGLDYTDLGNAAGSVFDGKFEWTGAVVQSRRPSTHGRLIRVWRWKGEAR